MTCYELKEILVYRIETQLFQFSIYDYDLIDSP